MTTEEIREKMNELRSQNAQAAAEIPQSKMIVSLFSTNADERFDALLELDKQRSQVVNRLLAILSSTNSDAVKVYAVVALGEYRAPEAVPVLVQHLDWDAKGTFSSVGASISAYGVREGNELSLPVSAALVNIGLPAIPMLLTEICESDGTNTVDKCVRICRAIEGPEVTQFRIEQVLMQTTDGKRKERIQSALDDLKMLRPPK